MITATNIAVAASDLTAANTLITVHVGGPNDAVESACINQQGTFTSCLNNATTHVAGGDNIGQNHLLTFSSTDNFAVVVDAKGSAQSIGSLTDLYLTFHGDNGTFTT